MDSGLWRIRSADGFVLFPGSDHVETVAVFEKTKRDKDKDNDRDRDRYPPTTTTSLPSSSPAPFSRAGVVVAGDVGRLSRDEWEPRDGMGSRGMEQSRPQTRTGRDGAVSRLSRDPPSALVPSRLLPRNPQDSDRPSAPDTLSNKRVVQSLPPHAPLSDATSGRRSASSSSSIARQGQGQGQGMGAGVGVGVKRSSRPQRDQGMEEDEGVTATTSVSSGGPDALYVNRQDLLRSADDILNKVREKSAAKIGSQAPPGPGAETEARPKRSSREEVGKASVGTSSAKVPQPPPPSASSAKPRPSILRSSLLKRKSGGER